MKDLPDMYDLPDLYELHDLEIFVKETIEWTTVELRMISRNPTSIYKLCTIRFSNFYSHRVLRMLGVQETVEQLIAKGKELVDQAQPSPSSDPDAVEEDNDEG